MCATSPHDYQRLKAYSRNMVDHHLVIDLVPTLAQLYFKRRFGNTYVPFLPLSCLLCQFC